jgi:hypothetical protein
MAFFNRYVTNYQRVINKYGGSVNDGTLIDGWFLSGKIHLEMDDFGVPLF